MHLRPWNEESIMLDEKEAASLHATEKTLTLLSARFAKEGGDPYRLKLLNSASKAVNDVIMDGLMGSPEPGLTFWLTDEKEKRNYCDDSGE
tara:strand:- start:795 stop:1067 length:273 start_codon:yes stop_codon:yes gene_type:complete